MLFRIPEESLKFKKVDKQKKLFYTTPCSNFDKKVIDWMVFELDVTVQDGGKTGAKAGVKLAYKHVFAPVFTSEEPPMLLVRPRPGKKMPPVLNSYN